MEIISCQKQKSDNSSVKHYQETEEVLERSKRGREGKECQRR